MKTTSLVIALAFCSLNYAQNSGIKLGDQAVFAACVNEEDPYTCTLYTFEKIINQLITPKVIEELKASAHKDALPISILFVSDEEGNVITDDIEIICENNLLQATIRNIIYRLPAFYPKHEKMENRKSIHVFNYLVYPQDSNYQTYNLSINNKQTVSFDNFATYKNCKHEKNKNSYDCFYSYVTTFINRYLKTPESKFPYQEKMSVIFFINTTGEVIVTDIKGGSPKIKEEIRKTLQSLPNAEPARIKGIPTVQSFRLPITINIH